MRAVGVRLAVCLAAGAVGAVADAREEPRVSIEAASITRREALLRVLEAAGEDYAIGPGFTERVALRLDRVPLSAVLRGLLRDGEATWTEGGVRRVAKRRPAQAGTVLRVVPAAGSDPAGLAGLVASSAGGAVRVAVDAEARLLILQGTAAAVAEADRIILEFESPLPCLCEPGDRDLQRAEAARESGRGEGRGAGERVSAAQAGGPAGEALLAVVKRAALALAPAVVEGEVSYRFREVPADAALQAVADVLGGGRIEGGALVLTSSPVAPQTRMVAVGRRPASQLVPVLRALSWEGGALEVSASRDRLVLRGSERAVAEAAALVARLDFSPAPETNPCGCRPS